MDQKLAAIYYDPEKVGSFGGIDALARVVGAAGVKDWMAAQDAYTLHKPTRRKFKRRKTLSIGIDHLWQIDLVDLSSLSRYNDGNRFLLTCIDCFSRFAWAVPMKNKTSVSTIAAFSSILDGGIRKPTHLQSDKGSEFLNGSFQSFLKAANIYFYTSENDDIKCALVERFNRTLKTRMWRYFTHTNSLRYVDILSSLVKSYNETVHGSIKTAPAHVSIHNEAELRLRNRSIPTRLSKPKFSVGDTVRISETKRNFKKGYLPGWTRELFTVVNVWHSDPPTYSLVDYAKEPIKGKFYTQELQKVTHSGDVFKIEKILKTRKRLGKVEHLVRWLGYPPKFDSWVDSLL